MPNKTDSQWTTVIRPKTGWFDLDLRELVQYRDLVVMFVKRNFVVFYKQTILGPLWILLNPLITTVIFNVIFGGIAKIPTDGVPSFLFYMAGNTLWTLFASCINNTANTFVANAGVLGKVYFPRLTIPVSQVLTALLNFGIQLVMYLCFWVVFAVQGEVRFTSKYRDLAIAVTFGVQLWMYATPVVYSMNTLGNQPKLAFIVRLNPMTAPIELFRAATLGVGTFTAGQLLYSAACTLVLLTVGVVLFSRIEKTFMDTV